MSRRLRARAAFAAIAAVTSVAAAVPAAHAADANGCDYYAAPSGNDKAAGTASAPVATAQALAWKLQAGQTGCLKAGTYTQEIDGPYVLRVGRGGAAGKPVTIKSAPGAQAKLFGIVYVPKGSDHVVIDDVAIDGRHANDFSQHNVGVQVMADDVTVSNSDITNNASAVCMILGDNSGWGRATHTRIAGNTFHDCGDPGQGMLDHSIYVQGANDGVITDNVFLRSAAFAVHFWPDAQRMTVSHNVMIDNGGGVIFASDGSNTVKDNVVEDNVIVGSKKRAAFTSWWGASAGTGNVARNNCIAGNPAGGVDSAAGGFSASNNLTTGTAMAKASSGDYRLTDASCLKLVGYDTVAKRTNTVSPAAATTTAPVATPAPTTTPAPVATETPAPTTSTPVTTTPAPAPVATTTPVTTTPVTSAPAPTTSTPVTSTPAPTTPATTKHHPIRKIVSRIAKRRAAAKKAKAAKAKIAKAKAAKAKLAKARAAKARAAKA